MKIIRLIDRPEMKEIMAIGFMKNGEFQGKRTWIAWNNA